MFCYQCQETAKGTGCILKGVCGKDAATARSMDLLLFVVRGIAVAADRLRNSGAEVAHDVDEFVVDALFSTITNANFDRESIERRVERALAVRDALKAKAEAMGVGLPQPTNWSGRAHATASTPRPARWGCSASPTRMCARSRN